MSTEQNKSIVRRWIEEGWNKHNVALVDELYAPDVVQYDANSPVPVENAEALKAFINVYLNAFGDLHFTTDDLFAEGDRVAWRFTSHGTHTGDLMGLSPTGRKVTVIGMVQFNLENNRIKKVWVNIDFYGTLVGIGAIPAPQH